MLDQLLYVQWAQRMASAVDTLRVVARSLPVLAVNRLSKVQPERTGCGGITDNVPPGRRPLYPTELRGHNSVILAQRAAGVNDRRPGKRDNAVGQAGTSLAGRR